MGCYYLINIVYKTFCRILKKNYHDTVRNKGIPDTSKTTWFEKYCYVPGTVY